MKYRQVFGDLMEYLHGLNEVTVRHKDIPVCADVKKH